MPKGLPYFKFNPDVWMLGNISFEDLELQGLYINVCALYWHRDGALTLDEITRRFKGKTERIPELTARFLNPKENGEIAIDWLDEQLEERGYVSQVNSKNGKLGGRPEGKKTKGKKPTANRNKSEPLPENTQKNRIEQNNIETRKEQNKKELEARKLKFASTLEPFLEKYGRPLLNEFYKYWTEPNRSFTQFRQEGEKTWDVSLRLEKWASNDKSFNQGKAPAGQNQTVYSGTFFKTPKA